MPEDLYVVRTEGFAERFKTEGGDGTAALWLLRGVRYDAHLNRLLNLVFLPLLLRLQRPI